MATASITGDRGNVLVTHNRIAQAGVEVLNRAGLNVHFSPPYDSSEVVAEKCRDLGVAAIMVRQGKITAQVIQASPNLKVIAKHGVGVDNVDLRAASDRGIPVLRAMGSNSLAVAEHTVAMMLALIKDLPLLDGAMRRGEWPKPNHMGRDIAGRRVGLVGYGAIGQHTARLISCLGMHVTVFDPMASADSVSPYGFTNDLDTLVAQSDIVSIHCPLTDQTRNLVDARRLSLMRPDAFVINTARGGVINEEALANALHSKVIAGAALDSFSVEPLDPASILFAAPNLIMTPHIGGTTVGAADAMAVIAAEHIVSVLDGNPPDARSLANPHDLGVALIS